MCSLYMGIEPSMRSLENQDFASAEDASKPTLLKGGFCYGANRRDTVYVPPRPLLNHGIHRCRLSPSLSLASHD